MKHTVKLILLLAMVLFAARASAERAKTLSSPPSSASTSSSYSRYSSYGSSGSMVVSGALGFFASGLGTVTDDPKSGTSYLSGFYGLGGDFEYFLNSDVSVGGLIRYYTTSDTLSGTDYTNSLTTLGGAVRAYLVDTNHWSFAGSSGVGFTSAAVKASTRGVSADVDSGMQLSLYLGMTLLYKVNNNIHLGVENLRVLGLGSKLNGWVLSDYMAKISFLL